jgi:p-hydroxybenzoate 3-monooxygenase
VGIIGAGPAGLALGCVLAEAGIDSVILERGTREYVENRARAGVVEDRTARFLREHGLAGRMLAEGVPHGACEFRYDGRRLRVPYGELSGGLHWVYPQQHLVRDLVAAYLERGGDLRFSHPVEEIDPVGGRVRARRTAPGGDGGPGDGERVELECAFVAGCDGRHGIARRTMEAAGARSTDRQHDHGWLAVLAAAPPSTTEIIYALHEDGFAGHMLRTATVSRYYLECPIGDSPANWSEDRIWDSLTRRLAAPGWTLATGPLLETSVLEMRSTVLDRMDSGRLYLAGDAAHVITPAGGKGMNLALGDAADLAAALVDRHTRGDGTALRGYSARRLERAWRAQEFSHWLLQLIHTPIAPPAERPFLDRLRRARLEQLGSFPAYAASFAHAYVGTD